MSGAAVRAFFLASEETSSHFLLCKGEKKEKEEGKEDGWNSNSLLAALKAHSNLMDRRALDCLPVPCGPILAVCVCDLGGTVLPAAADEGLGGVMGTSLLDSSSIALAAAAGVAAVRPKSGAVRSVGVVE